MPSVLRSVAAFAFVSALAVLSAPGCSQQGEGQRCDSSKNGDADCDDGLVCIKKNELTNGLADICCHSDPANDTKSRCVRGGIVGTGGTGGSSTGGSGGSSMGGGAAGDTSDAAAGDTSGGTPGASGSPTTSDGGMTSAAGTPSTTDGGGAAGTGTGGQGGAG